MFLKNPRFLDFNSGAGIHPEVESHINEILSELEWVNPSSSHQSGQRLRARLDQAKKIIASSLNRPGDEGKLVFGASGTECIQSVLRSWIKGRSQERIVLWVGAGEHASVQDSRLLKELSGQVELRSIPFSPDFTGKYDFSTVFLSADPTVLNVFTLYLVNSETGVIFPALNETISKIRLHCPRSLIHLDACQAWGKIKFDQDLWGADAITVTSTKIGAPSGVGVTWLRSPQMWTPVIYGTQQFGRRGGTENILGVFLCELAARNIDPDRYQNTVYPLRRHLERSLNRDIRGVILANADVERVANTVHLMIPGFDRYQNWMELLDLKGYSVSRGSACQSQIAGPNPVLVAMGYSEHLALNSLRVSLGLSTTIDAIDGFVKELSELVGSKKTSIQMGRVS